VASQGLVGDSEQQLGSNPHVRRRAVVPTVDQERFRRKQQDFERQLKSNKSKFTHTVEDEFRSLVKSEIAAYEPADPSS